MTIRVATAGDVAALAELRRAWTVEWSGPAGDPGYERAFAEWFAAEAKARDYARIVLTPSERAVPLYQRAGFVVADEMLVLRLGDTP